jgi:hypothetical protein
VLARAPVDVAKQDAQPPPGDWKVRRYFYQIGISKSER